MPFLGELSALLTACFWSGSSLAFASATKRASTFYVNITRLIFAACLLILLVVTIPFEINLSPMQLVYLSVSGVIGLAFGDTFLFKAYQVIGARITQLVMSLAPAVAAILAYLFLGEGLSAVSVLGIGITTAGVAGVVLDPAQNGSSGARFSMFGLLCALLAAVGQGAGLVVAKMAFLESTVNGFVATMIRILASLVLLLPFAIVTGRYRNPVRVFSHDRQALLFTVLGSIFGPFLGITFSLIAIEHTKIGIAATIMATTPIIMLPMLRYFYHECLTWRAVTGAFVAVAGVAILFLH